MPYPISIFISRVPAFLCFLRNPGVGRVVLNAIAWTAGIAQVDVPEDGVASLPVSEAQLNENLALKKEMHPVTLPSAADLAQPAAPPQDFGWPGKK